MEPVSSILSTLALVVLLYLVLRWVFGYGVKVPLGGGYYFRRWVMPTDPRVCKALTEELQSICKDSIGCLLPHPVLQGEHEELKDKIVFMCYDRFDQPVMFNLQLKVNLPKEVKNNAFHIGLVMVISKAKGKGLQKLVIINCILHMISFGIIKFLMTDIGDSPSAARMMARYMGDAYPNYLKPNATPPEEYVTVFKNTMKNHRKDMGVSSNAVIDLENFIVKMSNEPTGGGSAVLAPLSRERRSQDNDINEFFYRHVDPKNYDEMFIVGKVTLPLVFNMFLTRLRVAKV